MSQLTGFGQPHMSQHFSPMESGLSHQQNIHHLLHQEAQSIHHHQQQQQAALHQQRMAQASSAGEFMNQPGGVPCVKIVEQPAGNKLRFRLVSRFCKLFFNFGCFSKTPATKRQLSHISAALFIELSYFPLEHLFSFTFTFIGEPHSLLEAWRLLPPSWRAWPQPATFHVFTLVLESESGGKTVRGVC